MECNTIYIGETGRRSENRLKEHTRGEAHKTKYSLYERHIFKTGLKLINPLENYDVLKVKCDINKLKLYNNLY